MPMGSAEANTARENTVAILNLGNQNALIVLLEYIIDCCNLMAASYVAYFIHIYIWG